MHDEISAIFRLDLPFTVSGNLYRVRFRNRRSFRTRTPSATTRKRSGLRPMLKVTIWTLRSSLGARFQIFRKERCKLLRTFVACSVSLVRQRHPRGRHFAPEKARSEERAFKHRSDYDYSFSVDSIAEITSGESGVTAGSKRAIGRPLRAMRNLVKFHLISPPTLGAAVRYW
jgi:hypothetical protein